MRLLDRFWFHRNVVEIPECSVKARFRFSPKKFHHLHRFAETSDAMLPRISEDILVRSEVTTTEPDTKHRTSIAHAVQRRIGFRQLNGIAQSQKNHGGAQTQFCRDRRDVAEQSH